VEAGLLTVVEYFEGVIFGMADASSEVIAGCGFDDKRVYDVYPVVVDTGVQYVGGECGGKFYFVFAEEVNVEGCLLWWFEFACELALCGETDKFWDGVDSCSLQCAMRWSFRFQGAFDDRNVGG
jgi:hypothetical protein